ncbi:MULTISPECIES: pitrilysin family protein [unclassified Leeuwenhoekiella]|uniref:M16 family metallopeptidase n=1 Tax=unclassified Leeuwenhoekiella TaxID=2615029 RepID=UPI000C445CB5|nr:MULTISPECIES: pitrilysin family protein [unclassified Leeuwenhoekiella]MAW94516.1 peptidase M16 [Leeuwenhoekiella sp.]MBA81939.1 peptidase M16 [Leeuwenhoekiella sp.]|tara:strand:- start:5134 stop:8004 length:2871 start_codon:yes stop_codon:yes gene_type:complete
MIKTKWTPMALMLSLFVATFVSCDTSKDSDKDVAEAKLSIDYEKYELENGLNVVLHQDKSDPIVSVAIQYGVGSNREKKGRTGFAHLFEHMLFQESENVPQDQFFKTIQDAGGTLNGGTWQDGTVYYEVVPNNALETVLWLESDRMGFLINTVTESAFANQQEVVQNEKRQRVDNNPYGHTSWVIDKNLFPDGHPYSWQVIGELEDLQNATVEDVKEFYDKFYGPNNATLVIAGDFDEAKTKELVEKYFGEIKKRQEVEPLEVQNVTLDETKRLYHEDNFATAPQLNMVWPTVEQYTDDAYALDFLGQLLSDGKKAPLYRVLTEDMEVTSRPYAFNSSDQIAGKFRISVTANAGVDLDSVESGINKAFALFEKEGIKTEDIERIKAGLETDFYNGISSVLGKSFQLAQYDVFADDPGFIEKDIENIKAVTADDVMRVYEKYIKGKPFVLTSFVPKGQIELIAENSEKAEVVEEEITENVETEVVDAQKEIEKTPSNFDRSVPPAIGESPKLNIPESWTANLPNEMEVYGIVQDELPLVNFSLVIDGGHLLDDLSKNGVANLMTDVMMEGTANKTPLELEEAIDRLGASINMYTTDESIVVRGNTLARNFDATMALVEEILLQPRWDEKEFARIKTSTINGIKRSDANPNVIANRVYNKVLYGEDHPLAHPTSGTVESVEAITIQDLKDYYNNYFSPSVSRFHVVGDVSKDKALAALDGLKTKWEAKEVTIPEFQVANNRDKASLYFVDIPNAKQSVINIGYVAMPRTDKDFYPAEVMNYKLGGSFSGNVNLVLREEKGYTYGARSGFSGTKIPGTFTASSSVRTNTTGESVEIFRDEIEKYKEGISPEDLEFTKNALIKSNARRFETQGSLLGMLQERSSYDLDPNYIEQEEATINNMTLEQHKELANKYLDESKMAYLVVGDAATQYQQFKNMGFDEVKLLDKDGNEVTLEEVKK